MVVDRYYYMWTEAIEGLMETTKETFGLFKKIGNLNTMMTLTVSSRGNSLCVIIPKDLVEVSGIISGDKVRVWLLDHYRER
jgi:hypothetical protein